MIGIPARVDTARLMLRPPRIDDAAAIFEEYAADPEVARFLLWRAHSEVRTVADFLEHAAARQRAAEEIYLAITCGTQDRPIGMLSLRPRDHRVELGYVLGRRHWNQGYMTEAVTAIAGRLLATPGIFRVWAVCDTENAGSARMLEKSGFTREGLLRRWMVHPNIAAEPRDCYAYSRIR